jgi:NTE family protein
MGGQRPSVGLALSGGGFRAAAFHLGCLRGLRDLGVLDAVEVISSVSGGSLVAALYAYGPADFQAFDDAVVALLKKGLQWRTAKAAALSAPRGVSTMLTAGIAAKGAAAVREIRRAFRGGPGPQPPMERSWSRTLALAKVLDRDVYSGQRLRQPTRSVEVVINATELRTQSAFRFGSKITNCYRWGEVRDPNLSVADAVTASAAYPLLLPAIDRTYTFTQRDGSQDRQRVLLTDGGIYDNLGISCLLPGRSREHAMHIYNVDYIIAFDAGEGIPAAGSVPYKMWSRVPRAMSTMHRKLQDSGRDQLHQLAKSGELKGFALPYLGQRDDKLVGAPPDLVGREAVMNYGTNFRAMDDVWLTKLSTRGRQLTELLVPRHCPGLFI